MSSSSEAAADDAAMRQLKAAKHGVWEAHVVLGELRSAKKEVYERRGRLLFLSSRDEALRRAEARLEEANREAAEAASGAARAKK